MSQATGNIWVEEFKSCKSLRADFSNDRHHLVVIGEPQGSEQLSQALLDLAKCIMTDPHLNNENENCLEDKSWQN